MKYFKSSLALFFSLCVFVACNNKSGNNSEGTAENFEQERSEYIAGLNKELAQLEAEMNELQSKIENTDGAAKQDLKEQLKELQAEREEFNQHLQELKNSTEANWDEMKADIEKEWQELANKWDGFKGKLDMGNG